MSFQTHVDVMRTEAGKWDGIEEDMSSVATTFDGNDTASGAFSIIGKPLGDEHDEMAVKLTAWSGQGATRFGEIGDLLRWIADNYTATDADQQKRYEG